MQKMGKFRKGESGNPAGKPKGTKDWRAKLRDQLQDAAPDIVKAVVAAAKGGDVQAARIVLDKLIPSIKASSAPISIPLPAGSGFLERAETVFSAMAKGEVSPDDATAFLGALATVMKTQEVDDLEARITALERSVGK
jgi:hypothetical protein